MKNTQIYLLKLNSPSDKALQLWTGRSLHALRHCSAKQIGGALMKMQQNLHQTDSLHESMRIMKQVKEQFALVSTASVKATMEQDKESAKRDTRLEES
jgi:hypothetical protein